MVPRQKVVEPALGIGNPCWVNDPDFDLPLPHAPRPSARCWRLACAVLCRRAGGDDTIRPRAFALGVVLVRRAGQTGHFINQAPEKIPYAIQRFVGESVRIIGVLNTGLEGRENLAGDYSIADIATYPWVVSAWGPFQSMMPEKVAEFGNVRRWLDTVGARPAVQRGMAVPSPTS
jgi:glutathione S-transferase